MKKLVRALEAAFDNIQTNILVDHLYLAVTSLLLRVSNLHGLAMLGEEFAQVGLKESDLETYKDTTSGILVVVERVIQEFPKLKLLYFDFLQFLNRCTFFNYLFM